MGIRIPNFSLSPKFLQHYQLRSVAPLRKSYTSRSAVSRMNHEALAQVAGVDKAVFTVVVANIFDQMGQMMQVCDW